MQSYRDTVTILAAAATHPDCELRQLLCERIESLAEDLPCLLYVLVLESGDTVADLETQIGSRFTGFGQPGFCPPWEVIEAHRHWYELTFVLSDDGAGVVAFVPDTADSELLEMCRHFAVPYRRFAVTPES